MIVLQTVFGGTAASKHVVKAGDMREAWPIRVPGAGIDNQPDGFSFCRRTGRSYFEEQLPQRYRDGLAAVRGADFREDRGDVLLHALFAQA